MVDSPNSLTLLQAGKMGWLEYEELRKIRENQERENFERWQERNPWEAEQLSEQNKRDVALAASKKKAETAKNLRTGAKHSSGQILLGLLILYLGSWVLLGIVYGATALVGIAIDRLRPKDEVCSELEKSIRSDDSHESTIAGMRMSAIDCGAPSAPTADEVTRQRISFCRSVVDVITPSDKTCGKFYDQLKSESRRQ